MRTFWHHCVRQKWRDQHEIVVWTVESWTHVKSYCTCMHTHQYLWLLLANHFPPGNMPELSRVRKAGGDEEQALTSPRMICQSHGRSRRKKTVKEMDATEADVDMPGLSSSQAFQGCFSPVLLLLLLKPEQHCSPPPPTPLEMTKRGLWAASVYNHKTRAPPEPCSRGESSQMSQWAEGRLWI